MYNKEWFLNWNVACFLLLLLSSLQNAAVDIAITITTMILPFCLLRCYFDFCCLLLLVHTATITGLPLSIYSVTHAKT